LRGDVFFSQLAAARADTAAFQRVARQEADVSLDTRSGDLVCLREQNTDHAYDSYSPNPDRLLPDSHDILAVSTTVNMSAVAEAISSRTLTHLRALEAESIHILREVVAEFAKPVMLYSIGKDSSVMLRLAQKAFYPGPFPFPLLHIDTGTSFAR
jgi:hypothetical protein